jgi:hypothetical protein
MNLPPINLPVNFFIYPAHHSDAITPYNVESEGYFFARFFVFYRSDDALDGFLEDEIHAAIARVEEADHGAAVECEDGYAL